MYVSTYVFLISLQGVDFKIKTVELRGKKIRLQIWWVTEDKSLVPLFLCMVHFLCLSHHPAACSHKCYWWRNECCCLTNGCANKISLKTQGCKKQNKHVLAVQNMFCFFVHSCEDTYGIYVPPHFTVNRTLNSVAVKCLKVKYRQRGKTLCQHLRLSLVVSSSIVVISFQHNTQ